MTETCRHFASKSVTKRETDRFEKTIAANQARHSTICLTQPRRSMFGSGCLDLRLPVVQLGAVRPRLLPRCLLQLLVTRGTTLTELTHAGGNEAQCSEGCHGKSHGCAFLGIRLRVLGTMMCAGLRQRASKRGECSEARTADTRRTENLLRIRETVKP